MWEQTACILRAKNNPDNHLNCVMYDRLSLDNKLSGDVECLASRATVILVLPVELLVGFFCEICGVTMLIKHVSAPLAPILSCFCKRQNMF